MAWGDVYDDIWKREILGMWNVPLKAPQYVYGFDPGPIKTNGEMKMLDWKIQDEATGNQVKRATGDSLHFKLNGNMTRDQWKALKLKVDELYDFCEPEE
jgi:hypothetical protein